MRHNNMHTMSSLLRILLICCLHYVQCVQARLNVTEHDILKTLFDSTGGTAGRWNYTSMEGCLKEYGIKASPLIGREWNFVKNSAGVYQDDPCQNDATSTMSFMGVKCTCDAISCRTAMLVLPCGNLKGPLPSQLSGLRELTELDVKNNHLSGIIPPSLAELSKMQYLILHRNSLSGPIPKALGSLSNMVNLYLEENMLTGHIPRELGNLVNMKELTLYQNSISGTIPPDLGNATALTSLAFSENSLTGKIPKELGKLVNLEYLYLHSNSFHGNIPAALGNLIQLQALYLLSNSLTGPIPSEIGQLVSLQYFVARDNHLSGRIPKSLGNLVSMVDIILDTNALTGPIPEELRSLSKLRYLILYNNAFTGRLPKALGSLTSLQFLDLRANALTGPIIPQLFQLTTLKLIDLSSNKISGTISSEFGQLQSMQKLILANNTLVGSVPSELAYLKNLAVLLLQNNSLVASSANAFSFISLQNFTKLTTLDISDNQLTGSIAESIFALPALEVFVAGSNCFSGVLPSNICDATKLNTLAISGMSSASSCSYYYWKGTAFSGVFNGFGSQFFVEGSLPQCIYSMPNLVTVHAAGNSFLGEAPFSGEDKSGFKISPSLRNINVARNRLTGTISSQLVTAATSVGKLRSLDLSYNRIGGNLSIFSGNANTYVDDANPLVLDLRVNHLSGDVSSPLLSLKDIKILDGNVFGCSNSRDDLPANDYPAVASYQCGSKDLNDMLIAYAVVLFIICIVVQLFRHKQWMQRYVSVMKLWLEVAEGRRAIDKDIQTTHMKRYFYYFRDLRYFALVIGVALFVVFIVFVSLGGLQTRSIAHTYTWVTTAAYLSGETSAELLLVVCMCIIGLTWYMIMQNMWEAAAADLSNKDDILLKKTENRNDEGEDEVQWGMWLRIRLLPLLRLLILVILIWGVLIGGNVLYLRILLIGTPAEQLSFKLLFALFKLVWIMAVAEWLFANKFLYFGVEGQHHDAFLNGWLGGKVTVMFAFNAISFFWIPLLTIMVVRPECFHNAFIAAVPAPVVFRYSVCNSYSVEIGACIASSATESREVYSGYSVPFTYDYTCSSSILRTYIPLYQQIFLLLIIRGAAQLCYFCSDIEESERVIVKQKPEEKSGLLYVVRCCSECLKGLVSEGILKSMCTTHLMYNSARRQTQHKVGDERVFSMQPRIWIIKSIPTHLGALFALLTFAVLAPLLALSIILYIVVDTYVSQMVLGRFLVIQLGVIMEYKRANNLSDYYDSVALKPNEAIFVSPTKRARLQQDIEDATQPWGALAALKEVAEQCRHMPASTLSVGRTAFVFALALTFAFTVNDVLNNSHDNTKLWPSALLLCLALALEVLTIFYNRYYAARKQGENKQESSPQTADEKEKEDVTRQSIVELKEMSFVEENPIHTEPDEL